MKRLLFVLFNILIVFSITVNIFALEPLTTIEKSDSNEPDSLLSEQISEQMIIIAENDDLGLMVDPKTCDVAVKNKADGSVWTSNPKNPQEDDYTESALLNDIRSQLIVSYFDTDKNMTTIGSYLASVVMNSFEIRKIKNGLRITYNFSRETEQFSIPLEYRLDGKSLVVTVKADSIKEQGQSRISEIQILPYFLRGGIKDDGYLLVPDGSGALITLSQLRPNAAPYLQKVYGRDLATSYEYDEGNKKQILMPVYGLNRNGSGIFSIIEQNESSAYICANATGSVSSMANAYASFTYRQVDTALIAGKDWNYNEYPVVNETATTYDMSICYIFLDSGKADYSQMAAIYRDYLSKKLNLEPVKRRLDGAIEFFGKTSEKKSFLGIPYNANVIATSFKQASDILDQLNSQGVYHLDSFLYEFQKGGVSRYPKKVEWDSAVGGKKEYSKLLNSQSSKGSFVYGVYNFLYDKNCSFWGIDQHRFSHTLSRTLLEKAEYSINTYARKNSGETQYGLTAPLVEKNINKFSTKTKTGAGLALEGIGNDLYSDYSADAYVERQTVEAYWQKAVQNASKSRLPIAVNGGNLYILGNVDTLYDIPMTSSGFDCESRSIPFYSMVLHGYVNLISQPINMQDKPEENFLKCIENGVVPNFRITACSNVRLKDTEFRFLYNTEYGVLKEGIKNYLANSNKLLSMVFNKAIVSHSTYGNLSVTDFEGDVTAVVNYSDKPEEFQGQQVPANGYAIIQ